MKLCILLLAVAAAVPACSKPNDRAPLDDEAHGLVKCQEAKVAAFQKRVTAFHRATTGRTLPADVDATLGEVGGQIETLQQIDRQLPITGANLVKDDRLRDYEKMIAEDREQAEKADKVAEDDLTDVESWADRSRTAQAAAATPPATPPPPVEEEPVAPAPAPAPPPAHTR
jgi:hypothetical protein